MIFFSPIQEPLIESNQFEYLVRCSLVKLCVASTRGRNTASPCLTGLDWQKWGAMVKRSMDWSNRKDCNAPPARGNLDRIECQDILFFGSLQTILLCIVGELAGGGFVVVAVCISDM